MQNKGGKYYTIGPIRPINYNKIQTSFGHTSENIFHEVT